MRPPRRRTSNTTLVAMAFDHWFLIGSDSRMTCPNYCRVLDDSYIKFHTIYDNVFVCWSGNGEFFDELKKASPHDLVAESHEPNNISQAAAILLDWINSSAKKNGLIVELLVVGGIQDELYRVFHIRQDPKTAKSKTKSWKHQLVEVKGRIIAAGSGGDYAFKFLKERKDEKNKNESRMSEMGEEEAVKLAFDAIHAARKDLASGGTLRVYYQQRGALLNHHTKDLIIPEYCEGGYHPVIKLSH